MYTDNATYLLSTENSRSLSCSSSCLENQVLLLLDSWTSGVLLNPAHLMINVITAYVPEADWAISPSPTFVSLLAPFGVVDTVSYSTFERSRVTTRLKSRFALALGLAA